MKLYDYLKSVSGTADQNNERFKEAVEILAADVGTKPVYIRHLIRGHSKAGSEILVGIPIATNGQVTAEDLRPDVAKRCRKLMRINNKRRLRARAVAA